MSVYEDYKKYVDKYALYIKGPKLHKDAFCEFAKIALSKLDLAGKEDYAERVVRKTIKNVYLSFINEHNIQKKSIYVCPACRFYKKKEFLTNENGVLKCESCAYHLNEIKSKMIGCDDRLKIFYQSKINFYSAFASHSIHGFKCKDCGRFIPVSSCDGGTVTCPYEDCSFSGPIDSLLQKTHPITLISAFRYKTVDNYSIGNSADVFFNLKDTGIETNPEVIQYNASAEQYYDTLIGCIKDAMAFYNKNNYSCTKIQKNLMLQAYMEMTKQYPGDMVAYLVFTKQNKNALQAKIFQVYVDLIMNHMPFSIKRKGKVVDILSLTDPNLSLFLGKSVFSAEVSKPNIIHNNTMERYIGGNKFKDYGSCFIGKLIDVRDEFGETSLLQHVYNYNFSKVFMDGFVKPGTKVIVSHYRIHSHYEMGSLVLLQRVRKLIVERVQEKLKKGVKNGNT